jgi:hypothetical protein
MQVMKHYSIARDASLIVLAVGMDLIMCNSVVFVFYLLDQKVI